MCGVFMLDFVYMVLTQNFMGKVAGLAILLLLGGCSEKHAGGSSAETGNPEIAGVLLLSNGSVAASAKVQCLPIQFDPLLDRVDHKWKTVADSNGFFQLDSLAEGACNLEALHDSTGFRLLLENVAITEENTLQFHASLAQTGALRIGVTAQAEGDSGWVVVPGTSIARAVEVRFQSVFVDSLPVAILDSIFFVPAKGNTKEFLGGQVQIVPNDTLQVQTMPVHFETDLSVAENLKELNLQDTLVGFPFVYVLDSSTIDFTAIRPASGKLTFSRQGQPLGYQIVEWNLREKKAVIWIRLDSLYTLDEGQGIKLVYEEQDSSAMDWLPAPFGAMDSLTAVWHFEDKGDTALDAGPYNLHGVPSKIRVEPGTVGNGYWFNGVSSFVSIPGSEHGPLNFGYDANATFSVWVRLDLPNTSRFIFGKGITQYFLKYQYPRGWLFENNDEAATTTYHWYESPIDTIADAGKWFHLAVVMQSGSSTLLYVNGDLADSTSAFHTRLEMRYTGNTFEIGRRIQSDMSTGQHFWGVIDELQIWHVAQSASWIQAMYLNQRSARREPH